LSHLQANAPDIIEELDSRQRGLTVVVGRRAVQMLSSNDTVRGPRWDHQKLVDELLQAPQARRPIRELSISILVNGRLQISRLRQQALEPDPDWTPEDHALPAELLPAGLLVGAPSPLGVLRIEKAAAQLVGRLRYRNAIVVTDASENPVASY